MFSFDGDYKRRPQQSLGGASCNHDRDTIIRKAQEERRKRADSRRQHNGAIVVQSCVRSFLVRQRVKKWQRDMFDDFCKQTGLTDDQQLGVLLQKLLFFYYKRNDADGDRLIFVSQYLLKVPANMMALVFTDRKWMYRIKKFLFLCLQQIQTQNKSQAIPLRILETYLWEEQLEKHTSHQSVHEYLTDVYTYLIHRKYFHTLRDLIEKKCPPLDGVTSVPPNAMCAQLFQMLAHPLGIINAMSSQSDKSRHMILSLSEALFVPAYSEPVQCFVVPCLKAFSSLPYAALVQTLAAAIRDGVWSSQHLTTYMLHAFLTLDTQHLASIKSSQLFPQYIEVVAAISPRIDKLQMYRSPSHSVSHIDDDSSDEDEDEPTESREPITPLERNTLIEVVCMLNDQNRSNLFVEAIDDYLQDQNVLKNICQICHHLMFRHRVAILESRLCSLLVQKPNFIRSLWYLLTAQESELKFSSPLSLLSRGITIPKSDTDRVVPILATFCALFGRLISTLYDLEFCQEDILPGATSKIMPFALDEIVQLSLVIKELTLGLVDLAFPDTWPSNVNSHYKTVLNLENSDEDKANRHMWPLLLRVCVFLLRQLYTRDLRKGFCPEGHWTIQTLNLLLDKSTDLPFQKVRRGLRPFQPLRDFTREDYDSGPPLSTKQIRSITVLREIPFVVAFNTRVGIFQGFLTADKIRVQGELHRDFMQGPTINLVVRRSHLYEDSFYKLSPEQEHDIRPRFRVQMINNHGLDECGIDGGGVFREFLSELLKEAFDPNRGFFMTTTDNKLYPNPSVACIVQNFEKHFYFIGRILGKALYENLLVELPLADFFLSKLVGKHSDVDVHQLASLDPVLHRNLLSLKTYDGDVADLNLDFTVVSSELGETRIEELKPNGTNIFVNAENRIEYIQLVADYKLNRQIRRQCAAFRQGLANLVPLEWLTMFSNKELQVLISGAEIAVDVDDLRMHTIYGGEFSAKHVTIKYFWNVMREFTDEERRLLLKFVTSCSRPPLLGFKDLDPPFRIQNAGDTDRLPSASTCMNLLKLPAFTSEKQVKERLLYAIQSNAGFELS